MSFQKVNQEELNAAAYESHRMVHAAYQVKIVKDKNGSAISYPSLNPDNRNLHGRNVTNADLCVRHYVENPAHQSQPKLVKKPISGCFCKDYLKLIQQEKTWELNDVPDHLKSLYTRRNQLFNHRWGTLKHAEKQGLVH